MRLAKSDLQPENDQRGAAQLMLRALARCRSGDKGTVTTLAVIARRPELYALLRDVVTAERVASQLGARVQWPVRRYEMPLAQTLIFVCQRAAEDTVTTSLYRDTHGKTLSSRLLDMHLEVPADLLVEAPL